jgi:hypothetical protein
MNEGVQVDTEPYLESGRNALKWTNEAYDLLTSGDLVITVSGVGAGSTVHATGTCPRCDHDVAYTRVQTITLPEGHHGLGLNGPGDAAAATEAWVPIDVLCWCDHKHLGRATGLRGCGIAFRAEVLVDVT